MKKKRHRRTERELYLEGKYEVLKQFSVPVTEEIKQRIEELYPNDIAIENYSQSLILLRLEV